MLNTKDIIKLFLLIAGFAIVFMSNCLTNPNEAKYPQVVITYPADGAFVQDSVVIIAEAVDNVEIKKVEFFIDGVLMFSDDNAPYSYKWFINNQTGNHSIVAKAFDNNDKSALSNIVYVSIIDTTDTEDPQIAIVSPAGWSTVRDTVRILTSVSDNHGVARVIFYIDGDSVATDLSEPFDFYWNTHNVTNDYHTILAKAIDYSQNWTNTMITVYVNNPDTTDNVPPQIAIVAPAGWSTVSGTVQVRTQVSDNRGVAKVVFHIDGDSVYTDLTEPFSYNWNTSSVSNDYHTILAKAYDYSLNWANSMITVLVQNK